MYVKAIRQLKLLTSAFIKIHKTTAIIWATIKLNTTKEYWEKNTTNIVLLACTLIQVPNKPYKVLSKSNLLIVSYDTYFKSCKTYIVQ